MKPTVWAVRGRVMISHYTNFSTVAIRRERGRRYISSSTTITGSPSFGALASENSHIPQSELELLSRLKKLPQLLVEV